MTRPVETVGLSELYAALARRSNGLRDPSAAVGYLRVSVVNGARSMLRKRRTVRRYQPPRTIESVGPEDRAVVAEEHREVLAAVKRLADRQREVLVLRYWSGLSEAEIAAALGITPGTVKSTSSRALDALERILKDKEGWS